MTGALHRNVLNNICRMFDVAVIQNNLRGLYVEQMVGELLNQEWNVCSEDWAGWDIEHTDGTRIEIKQSAARQSWGPSKMGHNGARFSIRTPSLVWEGSVAKKVNKRSADIYIFAWHGGTGNNADQRNEKEWKFFVLSADRLPNQKSIGLRKLAELVHPVPANALASAVERERTQCGA